MRILAPVGLVVLVIISYCQGQNQDSTVGSTPENLAAVSQSVTNLAQKISLAIANPKSKTEIFSPVSIAGALSLLLLGSGGATRDELINVMGFQNSRLSFTDIHKSFGRLFQDLVSNEPAQNVNIPWRANDKCNNYDYDEEDYVQQKPSSPQRGRRDTDSHFISVANGIFVDHSLPLNPRYVRLTKQLYAGEITPLPLYSDPTQSAFEINQWVQQATRNKIQEIVFPDQVSNTPMVLANALYFKANWETMFIEKDTRPRPYFLNGRNAAPIDIDTMATSGCFPFYDDKQRDAKIVGLPYKEGKTTMYIILPNNSDRQKIRQLQTTPLRDWDNIIDQMVVKTGTVLLPKMKIENTLGLRDVLVSLSLHRVFNPELSNLSAITRDDPIFNDMNRRKGSRPTRLPNQTNRPTSAKTTTEPTTNRPTQQSSAQWVPVPLKASECEMANNCIYDGNRCNCDPNQQLTDEQKGCHSKPLIVQYNCPREKKFLGFQNLQVCLVEWYDKEQQCTRGCYNYREGVCFCCRSSATASQQQPNNRSPAEFQSPHQPGYQQSLEQSSEPNVSALDIANRFNPSDYSTTASPFIKNCQQFTKCDSWGNCHLSIFCALVNQSSRKKRQAENSPAPKLFVSDVLHKVHLDINEQGTEGGAVTAIVIDRISSSFNLRIDGPFLMYLRNDVTKLPLFYGAVFDPRA
ncbi:serine protease inhibitor 28Dc-like isoform X1 [Armigeres subalbatus]|uniref:serine protease inhibitor 28Dc-like isoform X1 n=1 Tax=Armigeres subalbatus TaxID=124917 RepID=UPI002ED0E4B0